MPRLGKFLKENSLSIVAATIFACCWVGQSITGQLAYNNELRSHGERELTYVEYVTCPHFLEATFENWESEFLQLAAMVLLTVGLRQKGSPESHPLEDLSSERQKKHVRKKTHPTGRSLARILYENSLGIVLFSLFLATFAGHAVSSLQEHNAEQRRHNDPPQTFDDFLRTPEFWEESFQNWQSEFLAVGTLTVLSIFLRQKDSSESKDVDEPNNVTGNEE